MPCVSGSKSAGRDVDHYFCFFFLFLGDPCNFQDDSCSFTQDNTDNFDWVRTKGSTPTPGTGPTVDHSYGSILGKVLFFYDLIDC